MTMVSSSYIFLLILLNFVGMLFQSGTTGPAKGVMLNHDNLIFTARAINCLVKLKEKYERVLTYLPLSHIAEQV